MAIPNKLYSSFLALLSGFLIAASIFLILQEEVFYKAINMPVWIVFGFGMTFLFLIIWDAYRYLNKPSKSLYSGNYYSGYDIDEEISEVFDEKFSHEIRSRLSKIEVDGFDNQINEYLEKAIDERIKDGITPRNDEEETNDPEARSRYEIFESAGLMIRSIESQIDKLERKATLSLALGIGISTIAIIILSAAFLGGSKPVSDTMAAFLMNQFPRVTLAIFIEIFGFFFLRFYKSNHNDIKYFRNELTNAESKVLALRLAMYAKNDEMINTIISDLMQTERNFRLKKDETTIGLENRKNDFFKKSELAAVVKDLLPFSAEKE